MMISLSSTQQMMRSFCQNERICRWTPQALLVLNSRLRVAFTTGNRHSRNDDDSCNYKPWTTATRRLGKQHTLQFRFECPGPRPVPLGSLARFWFRTIGIKHARNLKIFELALAQLFQSKLWKQLSEETSQCQPCAMQDTASSSCRRSLKELLDITRQKIHRQE